MITKTNSSIMKKLFHAFVLLLIGAIIYACKSGNIGTDLSNDDDIFMVVDGQRMRVLLSQDTKNESVILEKESYFGGLILPVGTKIEKIRDNPYALNYTLPEGYITIGKNARTQQSTYTTAGKITCTCTKGSGCSPYVATIFGTVYTGCAMSRTCSSCDQKNARIGQDEPEILDGEVIDMNKGISFITEDSDIKNVTSANSIFLDVKFIEDSLVKFASAFQLNNRKELYESKGVEDMPKNYEMVRVSVFGKALLIPIDIELSPLLGNPVTNAGMISRARLSATTCKCESGSIGCVKGTRSIPLLGSVIYCDSGKCTKCTLTQ